MTKISRKTSQASSQNVSLVSFASELADAVDKLKFTAPVTHVYNPLRYAWEPHRSYLQRCNVDTTEVLFLGMNPGPWGMAQTGVPFGQVQSVRDWLGIEGLVNRPKGEHPKRPIEGFSCTRSEVSGERFWGLLRERFGSADHFFKHHFVANYCPLVFMESSARNRTPDKLPADEASRLRLACDSHLRAVISFLKPKYLVGVGAFAESCFARVVETSEELAAQGPRIVRILHPSPASPLANRGWSAVATKQLIDAGVWKR